jgi:hypothetical protein
MHSVAASVDSKEFWGTRWHLFMPVLSFGTFGIVANEGHLGQKKKLKA